VQRLDQLLLRLDAHPGARYQADVTERHPAVERGSLDDDADLDWLID
jgi:hypothetical protein